MVFSAPFPNLKTFKKLLIHFLVQNAFSIINDLFNRKTLFLAERKLKITNIKLKIAIKLKNPGFYGAFSAFLG